MNQQDAVEVIPVVEEALRVETHERVTGRVRVDVGTTERVEQAVADLVREEVEVERTPVGRFVDAAPEVREEDGVMIVPVVEERLVVEKRLFLVEEVRLHRRRTVERFEEEVPLRRTEVSVTRTDEPAAAPTLEDPQGNALTVPQIDSDHPERPTSIVGAVSASLPRSLA